MSGESAIPTAAEFADRYADKDGNCPFCGIGPDDPCMAMSACQWGDDPEESEGDDV